MIKISFDAGNAAGNASHLALQAVSNTEILTAMQNGSGNLELIGWEFASGKVTRAASPTAGTAQEVSLTIMGRRAVTAVRSGSNNLLLISWDLSTGLSSIGRVHDSGNQAGEASQIATTAISDTILVTALRAGNGNLLLISWALNADGSFTRLGDSAQQAGAVSLVTIVGIGNNIVVTAVRNGSGNLELIAWSISPDGKTIHRQDPGGTSAGAVSEISLTAFHNGETGVTGVVTAVRNGAGDLLVIGWRVLDEGMAFERMGDTSTLLPPSQRPGTASHISISPAGGPTTFLTTMRRGSGDLELIAFSLGSNGGWTREGDLVQGSGSDVTETVVTSFYGRAVSAIRRADYLNVSVWDLAVNTQTLPILNTALLNQWVGTALADPERARRLKNDWRKLLIEELPVTDLQKESLSLIPAEDAKELQAAVANVVDNGGTIHVERDTEHSPGTLVIQQKPAGGKTPELSVTVFHCTFNAHCRNWHCGLGPVRK